MEEKNQRKTAYENPRTWSRSETTSYESEKKDQGLKVSESTNPKFDESF